MAIVKKTRSRGQSPRISNLGRFQNCDGWKYYPTARPDGYSVIKLKHEGRTNTILVHRGVHICFNDPDLKGLFPGATVDHADGNTANSCHSNLRWLSKKGQSENQKQRCQPRIVTAGKARAKRVRIWKVGDERTSLIFDSVDNACAHVGIHPTKFTLMKQRRGWDHCFVDDDDIDGEVWKHVLGVSVSNFGRFQSSGGTLKHYPQCMDAQGYVTVQVGMKPNRKKMQLSHLLLEGFGYDRPSPSHTADHINRNPMCNSISNLRWALPSLQSSNQMHTGTPHLRPVEGRIVGSSEWVWYPNAFEACEATKIDRKRIAAVANPKERLKTSPDPSGKRFEFRYFDDPGQCDLEGEEWAVLNAADWGPGGRYYAV